MKDLTSLEGYDDFLRDIKSRIQSAQVKAALALSREVVLLYWHIGREIRERQERYGWGAKVVQRLADDLKAAFPGVEGFSSRNLLYMRTFADVYPDESIVQQLLHNWPLPWGHFIRVLEKVKEAEPRAWYLRAAYEHGWSRAMLEHQIDTNLYGRQGKAISNFAATLPPQQSDLAQQVLKDPYNFDFLTLGPDAKERHLEGGLLEHVRAFLLETQPATHQKDYDAMLAGMVQKAPVLENAFAKKVFVEWGHRPPDVPTASLRDDQKIMDAENTIAGLIDILGFPARRLYNPVPTIEEFQVDNGANPAEVHSLYWTNETVLTQAADLLQRNV